MKQYQTVLKLGTRKSLLAWAQSSWVARQIERLNPGVVVELVGIETQGDRIVDIPLRQVEGKEFFVAELDDALRDGRVDFSVHSMKDLSLDRPSLFTIAAMPRRENPCDIVIFHENVVDRLARGECITIGTSSPRRLENIPEFLRQALPRFGGGDPQIKFIEIRGNVNTRIGRVHEKLGHERHLDGVVLAAAGLIRLDKDEKARIELQRLLQNCRWMLLPLSQSPGAPAQGVLAVECRAKDLETHAMLRKLHDPLTEAAVLKERAILQNWGGGCHQRFGAACVVIDGMGPVLWIKGVHPQGHKVEEQRWERPLAPPLKQEPRAYSSRQWRAYDEEPLSATLPPQSLAWMVSHSRALPSAWYEVASRKRLWTAGVSSWFRLAAQGLWVEGCADSLGVEGLSSLLKEPLWNLPALENWAYLTHTGAETLTGRQPMPQVATYKLCPRVVPEDIKTKVQAAGFFYWMSASQFEALKEFLPAQAHHACGPGKTAEFFKNRGMKVDIFPSEKEWTGWIKTMGAPFLKDA